MENKNFIRLMFGTLIVPMFVQAETSSAPSLMVVLMDEVLSFNRLDSFAGVVRYLLPIVLGAFVISRVIKVIYSSCLKRMLVAAALSFGINAGVLIITIMTRVTMNPRIGGWGWNPGWAIYVMFAITKLVEYNAFRRFGLSVDRKKLIKAIILADLVSYSVIALMILSLLYFNISLYDFKL